MTVVPISCCNAYTFKRTHVLYTGALQLQATLDSCDLGGEVPAPDTDYRYKELPPELRGDVMKPTLMRATPPWTLHGRAYVFPFRLPKTAAVARYTAHESPQDAHNLLAFVGGYGGYIFCDYHDSPVGPYKELVFVPGAYDYYDSSTGRSSRGRSVVSIWVNNEKSKSNGRSNWGLPKELADFEWIQPSSSSRSTRITVRRPSTPSNRGDVIIDLVINDKYSPISVPVRTKLPLLRIDLLDLIPLLQIPDDEAPYLLKTHLSMSGWVKPAASIEKPQVDPMVLPSMESLYGFAVTSFELVFKKPIKVNTTQSPPTYCKLVDSFLDKTSLQR